MTKEQEYEKACKWLIKKLPQYKDEIETLHKGLLLLNCKEVKHD